MSEFKIDKNVPLPSRRKYPFKDMEIGDSVFLAGTLSGRISGPFRHLLPKKFSYRKEKDGIRVWRIA